MNDAEQRPVLTPNTIPVQPPAAPYVNVMKVPQIPPKPPRWPIYFFIFALLLAALAAVPFVFPGVGAMLRGYLKNQPEEQTQVQQPQTNIPREFTQQDARALAIKAVIEAAGPEQVRMRAETLALVDARTITTEYGWIFFWNSKTFVETNDIRRSIPGTGPVVVTKKGIVEFLATNKSPIEAINEYEVRIGVRDASDIPAVTATSSVRTSTSTATTSSTVGVPATTTATTSVRTATTSAASPR